MRITEGGCLCGSIRLRLAGEPLYSVICHCRSCRRASGAPTVAWLTFERAQVEIRSAAGAFGGGGSQGELREFRSSPGVRRRFCGRCGTAIIYETDAAATTIDVTTACLDDPTTFPPTGEVWMDDRLWWQPINHALDHYAQGSIGGSPAGD